MKYPEVVAQAREAALNWHWQLIVYQDLNYRWWNSISKYGYCNHADFNHIIEVGKYPLIRLLMILPDGTIVQ